MARGADSIAVSRPVAVLPWLLLLLGCLRVGAVTDLEQRTEGLRLARQFCVTCHLFPDPSAADYRTWHDEILPRMKYRLGFSTPELEKSTNISILREHHRIPPKPVMSEEQWLTLSSFYFAEAPKSPRPQVPHEVVSVGATPFQVVVPTFRLTNQSISAIAIDPVRHELWLGDDPTRSLYRLSTNGSLLETVSLSNPPSRIRFHGDRMQVTGMGQLSPNDLAAGALFQLGGPAGKTSVNAVLEGLRRPVDFLEQDFDGDGTTEFVVAEFGNNIGGLARYYGRLGHWKREDLLSMPGTVRLEAADFDRDGRIDFAALVAQETEALYLFRNNGKGGFDRRTLFQKPPQYGHSHFETVDFDLDGRLDFLVSNGDNGEFNSPLKPYHGIRLYRSDTNGDLEEKWFYPVNGAYSAHAADFDGDGDLDIAAISYFPDYGANPRESFLYFENLGGWKFRPSTIKECIAGRWMVMAAGDLDGDGDEDVVLGSYIRGPNPVPDFLMNLWDRSHIPALILMNRSREPKP
jgi:hypothetical protein